VNNVRDVGAREGEVLQFPDKTPILGRIGQGRTGGGGKLEGRVNQRRRGLAGDPARSIQDLRGILGLREVHARRVAADRDAEEVVEAAHIGHDKIGTKR
jgi:hypothetical protein